MLPICSICKYVYIYIYVYLDCKPIGSLGFRFALGGPVRILGGLRTAASRRPDASTCRRGIVDLTGMGTPGVTDDLDKFQRHRVATRRLP